MRLLAAALSFAALLTAMAGCSVDIEDPALSCVDTGGVWVTFDDACAETCDHLKTIDAENGSIAIETACAEVATDSCNCPPDTCWNSSACVEI